MTESSEVTDGGETAIVELGGVEPQDTEEAQGYTVVDASLIQAVGKNSSLLSFSKILHVKVINFTSLNLLLLLFIADVLMNDPRALLRILRYLCF